MNWPHLHLAVNLVPLVVAVIGFVLLLVGVLRRSESLVGTGLALYVVVGVAAAIAYLTGLQAEEVMERLPGISEELIEAHEEAALLALICALALGLFGLFGTRWVGRSPRGRTWIERAGLLLGVVTALVLGWTANQGGKIRHPEIRAGFEAPVGGDEPAPSAVDLAGGGAPLAEKAQSVEGDDDR